MLTREKAIVLAVGQARKNPEKYMPRNMGGKESGANCTFQPHEWVIQSVIEASQTPLMTGSDLYKKYQSAWALGGTITDTWEDLDTEEQKTWIRLALALWD
jgi:hypothetical protein